MMSSFPQKQKNDKTRKKKKAGKYGPHMGEK